MHVLDWTVVKAQKECAVCDLKVVWNSICPLQVYTYFFVTLLWQNHACQGDLAD